jgi:hypothetical protein
VTCKLSGAHTTPARASDLRPYYQIVLAAFGPSRLMFGSDWPVSALTATYGQVCDMYQELTAQLTPAEQEDIFDRAARRVYHLHCRGQYADSDDGDRVGLGPGLAVPVDDEGSPVGSAGVADCPRVMDGRGGHGVEGAVNAQHR